LSLEDAILKGKQVKIPKEINGEVFYFRPITSWELDLSFGEALSGAPSKIIKIIVEARLERKEEKLHLTGEEYASLQEFSHELDYWIVYHAAKDWQPPDFSVDVIREMPPMVHDLAKEILAYTYRPTQEVIRFVHNSKGQHLATIVYKLNQPLAEAWALTPLQERFLVYAHPNAPEWHESNEEPGGLYSGMTMKEFMRQVGVLK
jgi:hypothetical protein